MAFNLWNTTVFFIICKHVWKQPRVDSIWMGTKTTKGQYMNRSTFQTIKYMNGSVFFKGRVYEWGRFRNTGSYTRATITPRPHVTPILRARYSNSNHSYPKYSITKTYLYNFDPLKPHFYLVKLGFTGVYIIFLISAQNIDCGYSLEPPRQGGSNEYPQSMFWAEIWKKY